MHILSRVSSWNKKFYNTLAGTRFEGVISPISDIHMPTVAFYNARHLLRTRPNEPVRAGDIFRDDEDRVYLITDHDKKVHAKTFVLIEMNIFATWRRAGTPTVHPVTRMPVPGAIVNLSPIWCAIESETALKEGGLNINIPRQRLITGAAVQLGDIVHDQVIKQLTTALGVQIGELE
jgi:hypothetical protein